MDCLTICLARNGLWERETERLYQRYLLGDQMEELVQEACLSLKKIRNQVEQEMVSTFHTVKDRLILHVEKGTEEEGYPSRQFYDMRIRYRIVMKDGESVLLNDTLLNRYDLLEEELYGRALKNCMERYPLCWYEIGENGMVMVKADGLKHGAGVMFYPSFRHEAEERMNGGYYILPSSVHEILIMPERNRPLGMDLNSLVVRVNEACVLAEDRLSEMAYHVEKGTGRMMSVREYDRVFDPCPFIL
jgi:hypothetical protein